MSSLTPNQKTYLTLIIFAATALVAGYALATEGTTQNIPGLITAGNQLGYIGYATIYGLLGYTPMISQENFDVRKYARTLISALAAGNATGFATSANFFAVQNLIAGIGGPAGVDTLLKIFYKPTTTK